MALVFVYGTLKRGGRNSRKLLNSRFVGEGLTETASFKMMNLGRAPGVVAGTNKISGEVFEVDSDNLHELDSLERLGWVYDRYQTMVSVAGMRIPCWIYVYKYNLLASILNSIYKSNSNVKSHHGIDSWNNCP